MRKLEREREREREWGERETEREREGDREREREIDRERDSDRDSDSDRDIDIDRDRDRYRDRDRDRDRDRERERGGGEKLRCLGHVEKKDRGRWSHENMERGIAWIETAKLRWREYDVIQKDAKETERKNIIPERANNENLTRRTQLRKGPKKRKKNEECVLPLLDVDKHILGWTRWQHLYGPNNYIRII